MNTKLLALSVLITTVAFVGIYPALDKTVNIKTTAPVKIIPQQSQSRIDVVFALDTTGSMGGLLQTAKEKIWSIATTMASAQNSPEIRIGLVAYRDRGDDYVTKVIDLTSDLDSMYARLMDFQAAGGGDGPEDVNQALDDAVNKMSWSQQHNTYKVVFLVGDAPPHMDYPDQTPFSVTLALAKQKGIVVNAIQCGNQLDTRQPWQQIATLGSGKFFQVEQAGGAVAIVTPHDKEIAELSRQLDEGKLYYGSREEKKIQKAKELATRKIHSELSMASRARRAEFNASNSGKKNLLGENELIDRIGNSHIKIEEIKPEELPASIAVLPLKEQKAVIGTLFDKRQNLQQKLAKVQQKRNDFLKKKVEKAGGFKDSLDEKIYSAIKQQADEIGIKYDADSASY